nr:hypothetical protein BaRGS_031538 [Batillaria attramentaria]
MAVVQDADLKQNLKDSGIKVAADLTKRQRAEIERVRSEGKFGYYKNGRLHVQDKRSPRDEQDPRERPDQRPPPDEEDERDAGDRQQQEAPSVLVVPHAARVPCGMTENALNGKKKRENGFGSITDHGRL